MDCAITILKNIGMVALLVCVVLLAAVALMAAGFGTAWIFGLVSTPVPTMGFALPYMVAGIGVYSGIEECRGY